MAQQQTGSDNLLGRLMVTSAIGWALWTWPPGPYADPLHTGLWYMGAFYVGVGAVRLLPALFKLLKEAVALKRAFGKDDSKGSAGFMSERDIRKKTLHKRRKGGRLIGIVGKTPLWLAPETAHFIVGPSGSAKTTSAIINILMGAPESALVTDIKGELIATTGAYRAEAFGHTVLKVDPKDPDGSVKINPLDDIAREVEANDPAALSRVRGIAYQLLPDPKGGGGQNDVFYKGGRNLIVTLILAVIVALPPEHRNLAMVYRALSDLDILHDLLDAASKSPALNGEIADMARSEHQAFFGDSGNGKTAESFRINATQALEIFGPGNYLAAITSQTTFHFAELKTQPVTLYILIDYANAKVLNAFSGLLQHMAAEAMVSCEHNAPVLFCLDEFVNAPMRKLCEVLTLLRYKRVGVVMATQDLADIERVYSKEDLETVLSESQLKQFLGGIRAKKTLEYLASLLGENTETVSSFSIAREGAQESLARASRKLLTEDELRRLPKDAQVVIYGNEKPILAKKVQVFAIDPWRKAVGLFAAVSTKRTLLPVELRVGWWGVRVSARGARHYRKMERAVLRPNRNKGRLLRALFARLVPSTALIAVLAMAGAVYAAGLPNLRWQYTYTGSARSTPVTYITCRYVGPTSPGTISGPRCPLILWRKGW